ncbi:MAG TPA: DJ-1/PfpI family protein [Candidatus Omnitrophota bacterium]|nr:DJ-1/PfpI family protein [Candidatus Omnitrophota bacterium]HSA31822.1 DJ-1/PfpI family protein [Candidatus Omnitrophota bacterium]
MTKRAVILMADGFEEVEAIAPIDILRRAGIEVVLAGVNLQNDHVQSTRQLSVRVDKPIEELHFDFDACIVPGGGKGAENLAKSNHVHSLISVMFAEKKVIAAICAAPAVVLAPTGILNNRTATCHPGMQNLFDPSTRYSTEPVVVDDTLITSQGPATALPFSYAIVERLLGKEPADKIRKATLWSAS